MKLKEVTIHKYKTFEKEQSFKVEDDITIIVGMNESGKTAILEAIAKTNYFQDDKDFKFDKVHDYPRREKKGSDKTGEIANAITCKYELSDDLIKNINEDLGYKIIENKEITISVNYENVILWNNIEIDINKFLNAKINNFNSFDEPNKSIILNAKSFTEIEKILSTVEDTELKTEITELKPYFENTAKLENPLNEYIIRKFLHPNMPKFLYYDEYYLLPSRIPIEKLTNNQIGNELDTEQIKTANALFELAELNPAEILKAQNFENFVAELEATEAIISDELFKYWTTNKNLNIEFKIDKIEKTEKRSIPTPHNPQQVTDVKIVEHILDIRVKNTRARISLPLRNRSKGFNWFFSFLVWFKKIQEDANSKYILLLDEPGLNLHASAQADMLRFIEDLKNYQVIYTTHSPFSIPSDKLHRVRTVLETENGSIISDSIQEKDPKTLFPLQAALGYDIAQNLFISKKNLLVEGVSDLMYLQVMSGILESGNKTSLRNDITIVPTGGLDKVATFISLMRGNKLEIACFLDTPTDAKGKARLDDMIKQKIIHNKNIRFFHEFLTDYNQADIEDLFTKIDYLKLFNKTFTEHKDLQIKDLNNKIKPIIMQINQALNIDRFNHYRPANELIRQGLTINDFETETINNFERIIIEINKLYE